MKEALKKILNEEEEGLKQLLKLLEEQYNFIIKKDVFKLESMVDKIKLCNKNIAEIEVRRREVLGKLSMKDYINSSEDEELKNLYSNINSLIHNLTIQKDSNDLLIKQNLSFVNKMLAYINPERSAPTYNSYGKVRK
ncbi:flagellar protein FlgN [Clostridium hydrogeniformans]|uniref:flagellar protein FlgN n=1 Tax=Clostridium hydrogeniformans TaxID=349933 RepID=UPI00048676C2|nr:flagellar protein FlgN [Clostridium hydrogeniformans]